MESYINKVVMIKQHRTKINIMGIYKTCNSADVPVFNEGLFSLIKILCYITLISIWYIANDFELPGKQRVTRI